MDLNNYLKVIITAMVFREPSQFAVLCKTREETLFVKLKFLELYGSIPDWLKPSVTQDTFNKIRIGNGSELLFLTNDRSLQGRTINHVALIVKSNDHAIPLHAQIFLEAGKLTKIYLS